MPSCELAAPTPCAPAWAGGGVVLFKTYMTALVCLSDRYRADPRSSAVASSLAAQAWSRSQDSCQPRSSSIGGGGGTRISTFQQGASRLKPGNLRALVQWYVIVMTHPTPYPEVNGTLAELLSALHVALGDTMFGAYLVGSLALGDFDPGSSDLDLIVVTDGTLSAAQVGQLGDLHARFASRDSLWSQRLEVVYVPCEVLSFTSSPTIRVPQVEVERGLFVEELDASWVFQRHTLREWGVVLYGPPPKTFVALSAQRDMNAAASQIAAEWLEDAAQDPTWLPWVREPDHYTFVLQTLCRLLYSVATGSVTSKPQAVEWARGHLEPRWGELLDQTFSRSLTDGTGGPEEVEAALSFIAFTRDRAQQAVEE